MALFEGKEWLFVIGILALVFLEQVGLEYRKWRALPFETPGEITAQILNQYQKTKDNKTYWVMKLKSEGHTFYTTSREDIKPLQGRYVRVYGKTNCSFVEYFRSCFFINFTFSLLPHQESTKPIKDYIASQHENQENASLFNTLFFADTLSKKWRGVSNLLGLAHILAISGFHLGILSAFLFAILVLPYRFLQRRFFTYRNEVYDIGAIILVVLFGYLVVLDFVPSFLRAYAMAVFGFLLYFSGLQILNFKLLALVGLSCIALFPSVAFNIGFILSMAGVFYIFLFVRYFPKCHALWYFTSFNIAVFFSITPIVHYFFPYFSPYQLVSILVSIAFVVYFPLMIVLHIFGLGGVLDKWLDMVLALEIPSIDYYLPWYLALIYAGLGMAAMFSRAAYVVMLICALAFYAYLCALFWGLVGIA
ncbi:hypothetical protein BA723_00070 [Helicobacter sp. CLO-3]|nr:hypothetical protein BA723_00070 [Helicobacter sp. CLO-3]